MPGGEGDVAPQVRPEIDVAADVRGHAGVAGTGDRVAVADAVAAKLRRLSEVGDHVRQDVRRALREQALAQRLQVDSQGTVDPERRRLVPL
eukprot:13466808-Alexandrium_andersonii.AAC.1